jgi:hypothetical protein
VPSGASTSTNVGVLLERIQALKVENASLRARARGLHPLERASVIPATAGLKTASFQLTGDPKVIQLNFGRTMPSWRFATN